MNLPEIPIYCWTIIVIAHNWANCGYNAVLSFKLVEVVVSLECDGVLKFTMCCNSTPLVRD
jgi:hypothetical protein